MKQSNALVDSSEGVLGVQVDKALGYLRMTLTMHFMISRTECISVVDDIDIFWKIESRTCISRLESPADADASLAPALPLGAPVSAAGDGDQEWPTDLETTAATYSRRGADD